MKINLSRPDITKLEIKYVTSVLKSSSLSLGPKLPEFEEKVAAFVGTKHAIAVNSGTSGLHLCVKSMGFSPGDQVITTAFSFIASSNCLLFEKVIPVFVDIDPDTLNIDPDKIEEYILKAKSEGRGDRIKGVLPVHVFGQPCDMERILQIADKYKLIVFEDACESLGSEYHFTDNNTLKFTKNNNSWRKAGTIGEVGVFAFYPNKQITTGEGGIIVTNNDDIASLCKSMRNQGRNVDGKWLSHIRLGYNYRLSDINCALGIAQLERIEEILLKRENVARMYNERLKEIKGVRIPYIAPNVKMSWFVYVILLEPEFSKNDRDNIMANLIDQGIGSNNYFPPIHLQPFYVESFGYKSGDLPITESTSERTIALPFYNNLAEKDINHVCSILKKEIDKIKQTKNF
ncbi:DegT/DnrJ/EryC1/StrS family aminotransferase [candidate division KSB1 bacterium]|nr:DegT/DnrJ/EryC1/StrS family aminotransferase [candidate division KSB1 bacterium]